MLALQRDTNLSFDSNDIDSISYLFFEDSSNPYSKRLTRMGWQILHNLFESNHVDLPDDYMRRGYDLLYLERTLNSIYYIDYRKKKIHLFDDNDALLLKLYGTPSTMGEAEGFKVT